MAKNEADKNLSRTEKLKRAAKNVLKGSSHAIKITHLGVRTLQILGVPLPFIAPAVAGLNALSELSEVREVEDALNSFTDGDLEGVVDNVEGVGEKIDRLCDRLEKGDDELVGKVLSIQDQYRDEIAKFAQQTLDELKRNSLKADRNMQEIMFVLSDICKQLGSRRPNEDIMENITRTFDQKYESLVAWMDKIDNRLDHGFVETWRRVDLLPDIIISRLDERNARLGTAKPEFGPKEKAVRVIFVQFNESRISPIQGPGGYWYNKFGVVMKKELEKMGVEFKNSKTVVEGEDDAEKFAFINDADLVIWGYLADDIFKVGYTNSLSFSFRHVFFIAHDDESLIKEHISGGAITEQMFYFTRALVSWRNGNYQEAYEHLTQAIDLKSVIDSHAIYFFRAVMGIELEYKEVSVLSDIEEMYRLDPDQRKDLYFYLRGWFYEGSGDTRQALDNYYRVVDLNMDSDMVFYSLQGIGSVHGKLRKFGKAIEYFDQALKIRREPLVLHNRGIANAQLGRLKDAVGDFSEVIEIVSRPAYSKFLTYLKDKADALYYRSFCYRKLHERKKADEDYEAYRVVLERLRQS